MQVITPLLSYPALLAYFSGADNYTWVYFWNGKRQLLAKPLAYFEKQLPDFIRIHKIALVNPAFVADVQPPPRPKMAGAVRLQDGTILPVSRRRWAGALTLLQTMMPIGAATTARLASATSQALHKATPIIRIHAILEGDALLLTEHCLNRLELNYSLQTTRAGGDLSQTIRQIPDSEWPVLLLIDARTERTNCLLSLETIKRDPRLRVIPVIWLNTPTDSSSQAYELDANSMVTVSEEPDAFVHVLTQLFHYWLLTVQFPFQ